MDVKQAATALRDKIASRGMPRLEPPDLIAIQLDSFEWFIKEGIREVLDSFSPIEDIHGKLKMYFLDYRLEEPKSSVEECKLRDLRYEAPLKVRVRFVNEEQEEEKESEIYLGDMPLMTPKGTFVVNGAERVVVSQLIRSPGVYFKRELDLSGVELFGAQIIPRDGSWLDITTDSKGVISARVGQTKKIPITLLLRGMDALPQADPLRGQVESVLPQAELLEGRVAAKTVVDKTTGEVLVEEGQLITAEEAKAIEAALTAGEKGEVQKFYAKDEALVGLHAAETYVDKKTGEILVEEGQEITEEVRQALKKAFPRKKLAAYELKTKRGRPSKVKVYRKEVRTSTDGDLLEFFGERITLRKPQPEDLEGKRVAKAVISPDSGKVLVPAYTRLSEQDAKRVASLGLKQIDVIVVDDLIDATLEADPSHNADEALEELHKRVRPGDPHNKDEGRKILTNFFLDQKRYDLGRVGRYKLNEKLQHHTLEKLGMDEPLPLDARTLTKQDLLAVLSYMLRMSKGEGEPDDIDHLANKRVRAVGELMQDQFRLGMLRLERVARERMNTMEPEKITPQALISVKPLETAIQSFLSSGQLSQYMDQHNPLAELNHRRRLSALGPGGLSRQSAKLEVRDVHSSHYGRLCPIETPEGPNIGLIGSLALYAKLDNFGFILTPYIKVKKGRLTDEIVYLSASEEENYLIAPADTEVDEEGVIKEARLTVRQGDQFPKVSREEVEYMDVSPAQVFSVGAGLIPFLENDDPIRGLMGSNMQRQAVPLVKTEPAYITTGIEAKTARDARSVLLCDVDGVVTEVDADHIEVRTLDGQRRVYKLSNFARTNQATCVNELRLVRKGQRVKKGQPLADGPAIKNGELALGRNLLVAFIPWEGYNYEDAIVLSERLVRDDVLTSVHIEKYEIEARDTKLGPEEITREIPNVGEDARRNLDERGIVRPGAEVGPQDILVGKVAPKGQTELTAEEKLVIAIFGKKAEEMRDVSLRMPHGESGKVIGVRVFSRYKYHCRRCKEEFAFSREADGQTCRICGGELEPESRDELAPGVNQLVRVFVAQERHVMVGDKMAGRHGNKGVISTIVPVEDMPYLGTGQPMDIVLNPLGVPTRMNVGQVLETHLGLVAHQFGLRFTVPVFAGASEEELLEALKLCQRNMLCEFLRDYLKEFDLELPAATIDYEEAKRQLREVLEGQSEAYLQELAEEIAVDPDLAESGDKEELVKALQEKLCENTEKRCGFDAETGRFTVYDGRTGRPLDQPVVVGYIYMLKLHHLVEDKIHARSTGPYSLVTQQPLGGKAQFGGQRFGEMEVWALEAYGAAHTLQELLTIKSDDVEGRTRTYEAIVKGENIQEPGVPESFKILVKELQALGLEVTVESAEGREIELKELDDETSDLRFMH